MIEPDRTQAAVKLEFLTQVKLRRHLFAVGPANVRQAHGPKQHCISLAASLEGFRRHRISMPQILRRADRILVELELYAVELRLKRLQDLDRLGSHIHPDPVAWQNGNVERS